MNLILQNIARHIALTVDEQEIVTSFFQSNSYHAKTIILEPGAICINSFFVLSGIVRSYTIDENGTEHIVSFACADWWIADMYSYISQRPGYLYIEINDDARLLSLSRIDQYKMLGQVPKMERYFRILIENSLVANQQRLIDNMTFTAEARYDKFSHKYPELINHLPQKQIASYIGVTPEFFSKMKSRLLRQ